jgi:hypothetical protein
MKVYALINDEKYDHKGTIIQLYAGDTFHGGALSSYPGARDYHVIRNHKRIWFAKHEVENDNARFRQLFATKEAQ